MSKRHPLDVTARPRKRRKAIPLVNAQLALIEAGYRCANPTCRTVLTLELHHIVWVKDGGGNDSSNLLVLCRNCHGLHTAGHIPASAIEVWKSLLVALSSPHRASVDLLLVLFTEESRVANITKEVPGDPPFRFTGDSLPALAGFITAGLLEISRRFLGANMFGGGMPSFEVHLTENGRRLVAAWREGQPDAIRAALDHVRSAT